MYDLPGCWAGCWADNDEAATGDDASPLVNLLGSVTEYGDVESDDTSLAAVNVVAGCWNCWRSYG